MRWIALGAFALCLGAQAATTIRTWTDEHGVVHYSDKPAHADAAFMDIPDPNIIDPFKPVSLPPLEPEAVPRAAPRFVDRSDGRETDRRAEKCLRATLGYRAVQNQRRRGYRASQEQALRDRGARYRTEMAFYC